ncbi:hypothetical protein MIND_01374000 [Mycena indigotica]|uniref:Uncharacterized protein n=1 Tax=Mycena indigotica TaxID=2126181 RepID=A0A8H6S022_9AGAR|nr:uncharacterized protein MIND_01374000 [Mycena indigotica]KAF7289987.1 hypothetical protein MIND_01374000 [Mycena indigotica]
MKGSDILLILVAILFPPCCCRLHHWLLLRPAYQRTLDYVLGYIPGHIHAFWLIYKKMRAEERYGAGGFRYVGNGTYEPLAQGQQQVHYGSTTI